MNLLKLTTEKSNDMRSKQKFYIPHFFSYDKLIRWERSFAAVEGILIGKLLSCFCETSNKNCVGFVSETGEEILCCKGNEGSDCWISVKGTQLSNEKEELSSLCKWLKRKGFAKQH